MLKQNVPGRRSFVCNLSMAAMLLLPQLLFYCLGISSLHAQAIVGDEADRSDPAAFDEMLKLVGADGPSSAIDGVGFFGSQRILFSKDFDGDSRGDKRKATYSFELDDCKSRLRGVLKSSKFDYDVKSKTFIITSGGKQSKLRPYFTTYKDVSVVEMDVPYFKIGGTYDNLKVRVSRDKRYILSDKTSLCTIFGEEPHEITLTIRPDALPLLKQWAADNQTRFVAEIADRDTTDFENEWTIFVGAGQEGEAQTQLRSRDWVIDTWRHPIPLGPSGAIIQLPKSRLLSSDSTQLGIKLKLLDILRKAFPKITISDESLNPDKAGYGYTWKIIGSSVSFGLPAQYRDHWLEADVYIEIYQIVSDSKELDQIEIIASDGYLPKWDDAAKAAPPETLIHAAHLDSESDNPALGFGALDSLLKTIKNKIQAKYGGEILN